MYEAILGFILVITPLVFFHELGHYLLAKHAGVKVEVFSIGFGKELLGFTDRSGTRWRLSLVPLGGYVKLMGENPNDTTPSHEGGKRLDDASVLERLGIISFGPIANILLTIVILIVVNISFGVYQPANYLEHGVGAVSSDSAASRANLQAGDVIVDINGMEIKDFSDITNVMKGSQGTPMLIQYQRGETLYQDSITPTLMRDSSGNERYLLGVSAPVPIKEDVSIVQSVKTAFVQSYWLGTQILYGIGGLISGSVDPESLGGPIKIAQYSGETFQNGLEQFLLFAAMLSINLAVINLFPIPGLDGGHFVIIMLEGILRRKPSAVMVNIANNVGILFVLSLIVLVSLKDVYELFQ